MSPRPARDTALASTLDPSFCRVADRQCPRRVAALDALTPQRSGVHPGNDSRAPDRRQGPERLRSGPPCFGCLGGCWRRRPEIVRDGVDPIGLADDVLYGRHELVCSVEGPSVDRGGAGELDSPRDRRANPAQMSESDRAELQRLRRENMELRADRKSCARQTRISLARRCGDPLPLRRGSSRRPRRRRMCARVDLRGRGTWPRARQAPARSRWARTSGKTSSTERWPTNVSWWPCSGSTTRR